MSLVAGLCQRLDYPEVDLEKRAGPGQRSPYCSICLDGISVSDPFTTHTTCYETFHSRCLNHHIGDSRARMNPDILCPWCRGPITKHVQWEAFKNIDALIDAHGLEARAHDPQIPWMRESVHVDVNDQPMSMESREVFIEMTQRGVTWWTVYRPPTFEQRFLVAKRPEADGSPGHPYRSNDSIEVGGMTLLIWVRATNRQAKGAIGMCR